MTIQQFFSGVEQDALCRAMCERFDAFNVRCGGVASIMRMLKRFAEIDAKHSCCVVKLLEVGTPELDVVVYENDDAEPKSFVVERWNAVLGYQIDQACIETFGAVRCAMEIFWEMTFFSEDSKM